MRGQKSARRAMRRGVLFYSAALAALAGAAGAQAQETETDDDVIVVTGSRIPRSNVENNVPTILLGEDQLESQGFENLADIATQLPGFAPSFGGARTQSTFSGATSSGLNTINLRNLSSIRTVVLMNGRRLPATVSSGTSSSVDLNAIPTANIERIEILTGGASAIYGADAVAGVVNIITKQDFEGFEFGASYGVALDEYDNKNPSGYVMFGTPFADDRGHISLTAQYDYQGLVSCRNRFLCAEDFAWLSPSTQVRGPAAYSGVGLNGRFFLGANSYTSRNGSYTDANGALIPFSVPIDGFNRNAVRSLAIPTERIMLAAEANYDLAPRINVFTEINYASTDTEGTFEGHPFQSQQPGSLFGGGPGVPGLQATIPVNNPFIPAALLTEAQNQGVTEITWWQRFEPLGSRGATNFRETMRFAAGLRGDFDTLAGLGSDWSWEASYVFGRTNVESNTEGLVATDRLYYGLRVEADPANPGGFRCVDPGARAAGCIPINPFAPYTQAMSNYLAVSAGARAENELEQGLAFITGSLFELPAGPLQVALGVESRRTSGFIDNDDVINRGLVTGNQISDNDQTQFETNEGYVETIIPVLADAPFAQALSLEGAYRWSETNDAEYETWKYGGEWSPIDGFRLRAMRARAVRTPTLIEVTGIFQTFGVVADPCTAARRNANATRAANCDADGVPANYAPPLVVEQSVAGFSGGNPNLVPEEATTLTYGLVAQPDFLPGFTLTVDRFEIELEGIINTVGRQTQANLCYDTVARSFCNNIVRGSNPVVPGANYVLNAVNDQLQNVREQTVKGVDIEASYTFPLNAIFASNGDPGELTLRGLVTIYDEVLLTQLPGTPPIDLLGFAGGSTSDQGFVERQGTFSATYDRGPVNLNWTTRWVGEADMSPFVTGFPKVDAEFYHSLRFGYDVSEGSEVYFGITNLTNEDPPFFATAASGTQALDTIPGYYDIFGRQAYAGFRLTF